MKKTIVALVGVAVAGSAALPPVIAFAQNLEVIAQRQQIMKNNGRMAKAATQMLKGETPFDPAQASEVFRTINADAKVFITLFPEDSKTGGDTEAAPAIWERPDDFKAANDKMITDSQAAIDSNPQTLEAFQTAFGSVSGNCRSCHEAFRVDN